MKRKLINSQMSNFKTYQMYLRQMVTLAENVFEFKNLPEFIDTSYLNKTLLKNGSVAFFKDDVMGVLALPYVTVGNLDVYGRPKKIQVIGQNGYSRYLKNGEFVIMYDNNGRYPLYADICQYAERIAQNVRVNDINVSQQKTPRFWKTTTDKEKTIRDLVNNVDGFENVVITYDDLNVDDSTMVLAPAPLVVNDINTYNKDIWAEFYRLIGIASLTEQKKERMIRDEMTASQGGTIASRFSRFEPRQKAVELINKMFDLEMEVQYYDGVPSTIEESEVEYDVSMDSNDANITE